VYGPIAVIDDRRALAVECEGDVRAGDDVAGDDALGVEVLGRARDLGGVGVHELDARGAGRRQGLERRPLRAIDQLDRDQAAAGDVDLADRLDRLAEGDAAHLLAGHLGAAEDLEQVGQRGAVQLGIGRGRQRRREGRHGGAADVDQRGIGEAHVGDVAAPAADAQPLGDALHVVDVLDRRRLDQVRPHAAVAVDVRDGLVGARDVRLPGQLVVRAVLADLRRLRLLQAGVGVDRERDAGDVQPGHRV
jgi:hypothetical protein